ncbi:hypothetical protein EK21DRAFT_80155 [Setomelanomma holmii]|uniref:CCR4-NOT transcription complex subunit 11 n=1 Tax=Setomelanomma holmii TaxID=210430 RepID=A0A9P4GXE4_9PLEO|nr:hypothetical protein EK21DRAFT_80155 [Setomelanomma holmii]
MNLTATLTPGEIETLSNPHGSIQHTSRTFERLTDQTSFGPEGAFEKSIRIKNTLDYFEELTRAEPSWRSLAILMNCEYQLWRVNEDILLKLNPFLSHWVEAIQRLGSHDTLAAESSHPKEAISTYEIDTARVLWIKTVLHSRDIGQYLASTPVELASELLDRGISEPFDLQSYVRMLEDEGIYEKTPEPESTTSLSTRSEADGHSDQGHKKATDRDHSFDDDIRQEKESILRNIKEQPETAIFELTHLPINITYLDFLTTLLADHTLEKHSIDPAHVITQYIQHALRTIERMEKPPSPPSEPMDEWSDDRLVGREELEYGKEAQTRRILLLLLFIKSLIRKGVVELDVLYFEIAEITVRYVWIKEVREFRTWAEEGIEVDGARG